LGSTGRWPAPPADSPAETRSVPGADKKWAFGRGGLAVPLGESFGKLSGPGRP